MLRAVQASQNEPVAPENVDLSDPELQMQIDALLQELDPDMLMVSPSCHSCHCLTLCSHSACVW
jgi:hypothetical protein